VSRGGSARTDLRGAQRKSCPYGDRRWLAFAGPPPAHDAQLFI
jgi:hypothetical protein